MMLVLSVNNWDTLLMVYFENSFHFYITIHIVGVVGSSTVYYSSSAIKHNIIDLNCTGNENTILNCP